MAAPDLPSAWKNLYAPSAKQPALVEVPPLQCLMIDGEGDPNTSTAYQQALETLYAVSYTLKFAVKKAGGPPYRVMPLEGLWWSPRMEDFLDGAKGNWHWTSLIVQPDFVTAEQVEAARLQAAAKKSLPALPLLRFEVFREGLCAQILHIGPYSAEAPTIQRLHAFIENEGYHRRGKHHEIYLGDPRRSAPETLKTILRQPVDPA